MGTAESSIRAVVLHLLETIPNNETQRELSHATIHSLSDGKLTLVTQGGVSKLPRLLDLASRWRGPISCGIYITTTQQLDQWLAFMEKDHDGLISKYVSFHVLIEQPQMPEKVNRHPINKLRNLALRNVETEFIFLNDIDFIPTMNAHDIIAPRLKTLPSKHFWVLPAFERFGTNSKQRGPGENFAFQTFLGLPAFERFGTNSKQRGPGQVVDDVSMIPKTKDALLEAISKSEVAPFHVYFKPGHGPTNYTKWYDTISPYAVDYDYLYEPYVICRNEGVPSFFPSFRGFAFNKMSFFMEAHYLGFNFIILQDLFVVHMNHGGRKGRNDKGGNSHLIKQDFRMYLQRIYGISNATLNKW
eukprot:CAMPEP_0194263080 /NCGR_PEP_ID=MMETSP0158-20130606/46872_1 /TAXON_ID=33649 /ORGANISM="Thalassionema nitzschioides, Strain L26-B" /LENGTH=357 /DNA_ID=CAMNT_0039003251 /DNA_START=6 /DNA_END=1077 /DNA_ORIENTATION=+